MHTKEKKVWKKNLYENEGFPDNYTHKTFLKDLKRNVQLREVSLWDAMIGAGLFTQEICSICLFSVTFIYLHNDWGDPQIIFIYTSLITLIGFALYRLVYGDGIISAIGQDIRTVLIFLVFGYISSPVLHTLTDTVSTDTIYSMATFMMIIHLIFFDYGISAAIVSSSLSLNAAIFGSICLASRLSSPFHAFVLMTIAVEYFALFPKFRSIVSNQVPLIFIMVLLSIYFLYSLSTVCTIVFILFIIFTNIMCPIWFLRWYRYKDNIYGPWDEAVVEETQDIEDLISY